MSVRNVRANRIMGGLVSLAFLVSLFACSGGTPPSPAPPAQKAPSGAKAKPEPPKVAEVKGVEKKEEEFTYNPAGKPDPFKPFIQLTSVRESKATTPLGRYEISQLKLVAIISAPEGNIALVEDAAGKGYFLRRGTEIGKNEGKVTKILKDRVLIEEVFQDVLGQTKRNEVEMVLRGSEEGGEKP